MKAQGYPRPGFQPDRPFGSCCFAPKTKGLGGQDIVLYHAPNRAPNHAPVLIGQLDFPWTFSIEPDKKRLPIDSTISCILIFYFFRLDLCLLKPLIWK